MELILIRHKIKSKIFRKSQSSIEFVILTGFLLFVFIVIFLIINNSVSDKIRERKNMQIKEIAIQVQDEIAFASRTSDGYKRIFKIPEDIEGMYYDINLTENLVYIRLQDNKMSMALPIRPIDGKLVKGNNQIRRINDRSKLNSDFEIKSDFINKGNLNINYTFDGNDVNPEINILSPPSNTRSFAIIMKDMNNVSETVHWILWNISSSVSKINLNESFKGFIIGRNDFGQIRYSGPRITSDERHLFTFKVYALNNNVTLALGSSKEQFLNDIKNKIIEETDISGYYK